MDDPLSSDALDDVAYLARSENRVRILGALANGPRTRRDVQETTDVSRTTLDRIVNELEDRGWVERTSDGDYAATPTGKRLMNQFEPFVESVDAIDRLGKAVEWLPDEELSIGLEHFSDATVEWPEVDPTETVDMFVGMVNGADEYYSLTHFAPPAPISRAIREGVTSGDLAMRTVATETPIEYLREHPDRRERWRETVDGGAELFEYGGSIPCNLWIIDDVVMLKNATGEPVPDSYGSPIVSHDPTVRSWAMDLLDDYETEARPLTSSDFAVESDPEPARSGND